MWWDWSQITFIDSFLFAVLSLFALYFVGHGLLRFISVLGKRSYGFLNSFDFIQKVSFRILFGFVFIFLFILIFSAFNAPLIFPSIFILALACVGTVVGRKSFKPNLPKFTLKIYAPIIVVFCVLTTLLFLSSSIPVGHYGGTNDDSALHSLIVRVLLDHSNALFSRSSVPFGNFVLDYPSGAHVLCGFFVALLGVAVQKVVLLVSVILPVLIAFATYSSLKSIFQSLPVALLGLIIVPFFTGLTILPIAWGGLPLLLSFYLSISCLGLFYVFLLKERVTWFNAFLMGLVIFIAAETYPDALFVAVVWLVLVLIVKMFSVFRSKRSFSFSSIWNRRSLIILFGFLLPVMLAVPYFYSIYTSHIVGVQFSNMTNETSSLSESIRSLVSFNWFLDLPQLSVFFAKYDFLFQFAPWNWFLLIGICLPFASKRLNYVFPLSFRRGLILFYLLFFTLIGYLTLSLNFQIDIMTSLLNPLRVWQHLFIPGTVFLSLVFFFAFSCIVFVFNWLLDKRPHMPVLKYFRKKVWVLGLLIMLGGTMLSYGDNLIDEQQNKIKNIDFQFGTFETIADADISLMGWINDHLSANANILVSMGDSGQFVMPITGRYTVCAYSYIEGYEPLMKILTSNASNSDAIPLLAKYNISYIYVGSMATTYNLENPTYRHFDVKGLLSSPNFMVVSRVGDAWLFSVNGTAATV